MTNNNQNNQNNEDQQNWNNAFDLHNPSRQNGTGVETHAEKMHRMDKADKQKAAELADDPFVRELTDHIKEQGDKFDKTQEWG